MSESGVKKCPKCGGEMARGEALVGYGVWGFRLKKHGDWVGDKIVPYYCKKCGYIEFYREG